MGRAENEKRAGDLFTQRIVRIYCESRFVVCFNNSMSVTENLHKIKSSLPPHVTLVAVSKTYPAEKVMEAYNAGHRAFGENKVQEMVDKYEKLPKDIEWHLVGHLQTNKVKYIAPFVTLIHSVDSMKLLQEIDK